MGISVFFSLPTEFLVIDIFHLFVLSLLSFYKYFSSFDLFIFPENYGSNVNNQVRYTQNLGFVSVLSVLRMLRSTNSQFDCYCKSITAMVVFSVSSCRICFLIFGRHSNSIPRNRTQTKHSWARCAFFSSSVVYEEEDGKKVAIHIAHSV